MRRSAIDCLGRGLTNVRANWELVLVQWLQMLLVTGLTVAGLVPPLAVLGLGGMSLLRSGPAALERQLSGLLDRLGALALPLALGLLGMLVLWTAAFLVYCFFQGGVLGVLAAADRQAPPGPGRDAAWFRTFRLRDLFGWGGRYLWRYFWLYNLYLLVVSLLLLLGALVAVLAVRIGQARGAPAGFGIGCGGALPLVFCLLVTVFWLGLAQADLAREQATVGSSSRRALRILGHRLGAVLLLYLLFLVFGVAIGATFGVVSFGAQLGLRHAFVAGVMVRAVLLLAQWFVSSALAITVGATMIALVRSEAPEGETGV